MTIPAYPLQWPTGWKRTASHRRSTARFGRASRSRPGGWDYGRQLTVAEAVDRLRGELSRMNIHDDDLVISTDLQLRLDGLPRSGQAEPQDPGAAAYWRTVSGDTRCMAIDRYDRVADNLAESPPRWKRCAPSNATAAARSFRVLSPASRRSRTMPRPNRGTSCWACRRSPAPMTCVPHIAARVPDIIPIVAAMPTRSVPSKPLGPASAANVASASNPPTTTRRRPPVKDSA